MTKHLLTLIFSLTYIFSLNAQTWEEVNESPFTSHHSINFSLDGKGYSVAGSVQNVPSTHFYSYNPVSGFWTKLTDYPGPTRGFGIGDTWDGKAYIGFGVTSGNSYLNDLWVFDPATEEWTELASCPCAARSHPTFVAHEGKIFLGMGGSANGNLNDWWEYDIATNTWAQKPDFPSSVRHHPYQFAIGDYVYTGLGHGNSVNGVLSIYNEWYRYDPQTEQWDQMADLPAEGRVAGTQFSHNGKGYVLSGDGDNHDYMDTGEFWEYDPVADSWTELPPHPGTSRWAPSSFVIDGYAYLMTGLSQSFVEDLKVYKYFLDGTPPTSTKDIANEVIEVSPNPTSDVVTIKLKESSSTIQNVSLFNQNGQLVLEKITLNNKSIAMNIQHLPVGVYYLKVELDNEVISQKIIKQ